MKNLIVRFIVGVFCISFNLYADENGNTDKQNEFQRITLQRSWHYASLLRKEGSLDIQQEHARTMVIMAFHYWIMKRHNLIERMAIHESQIKNSFKAGDLNLELLKDPLGRFTADSPRYGLPGFNLTDEEYKKLLPEFKDFIIADN